MPLHARTRHLIAALAVCGIIAAAPASAGAAGGAHHGNGTDPGDWADAKLVCGS